MNTTETENEAQAVDQPDTCKNCKYWFYVSNPSEGDAPEFGRCKRNPPLLLNIEDTTYTGFPMIVGTEWCGEHKRK